MAYFEFDGKKIYYEETGEGRPLLLLHGNTASGRMFDEVKALYEGNHKVVVIDFLGHGRSDRMDCFPADLWFEEGRQVAAFLDVMGYENVDLIGSSGGAQVALNVALERPELIRRVIADSFEGECVLESFTENVVMEREASKRDPQTVAFYLWMQGEDWEQVVDNDTRAIAEHAAGIKTFFHRPLEGLKAEVLLTGSLQDEFVGPEYFKATYGALLKKIPKGRMHLFEEGGHPAMLSGGETFAEVAERFFADGE